MSQIAIDTHDAARAVADPGVAGALRRLADQLNDVERELRRLLVSKDH